MTKQNFDTATSMPPAIEPKEELEKNIENHKKAVTERILAIAAMKSILNDASGATELVKAANDKLNLAFIMEESYAKKINELEKEIKKQELAEQQTEEPDKKARAKAILGIGGQE